jgi:hypothetical protein
VVGDQGVSDRGLPPPAAYPGVDPPDEAALDTPQAVPLSVPPPVPLPETADPDADIQPDMSSIAMRRELRRRVRADHVERPDGPRPGGGGRHARHDADAPPSPSPGRPRLDYVPRHAVSTPGPSAVSADALTERFTLRPADTLPPPDRVPLRDTPPGAAGPQPGAGQAQVQQSGGQAAQQQAPWPGGPRAPQGGAAQPLPPPAGRSHAPSSGGTAIWSRRDPSDTGSGARFGPGSAAGSADGGLFLPPAGHPGTGTGPRPAVPGDPTTSTGPRPAVPRDQTTSTGPRPAVPRDPTTSTGPRPAVPGDPTSSTGPQPVVPGGPARANGATGHNGSVARGPAAHGGATNSAATNSAATNSAATNSAGANRAHPTSAGANRAHPTSAGVNGAGAHPTSANGAAANGTAANGTAANGTAANGAAANGVVANGTGPRPPARTPADPPGGASRASRSEPVTSAEPLPPEPPAPSKRVRVVLSQRNGTPRPVRTVVDVQELTQVGEVLSSSLLRSQLALALRIGGIVLIALGSLPAIFVIFPVLGRVEFFGLRLPWLLLGVLSYPFMLALGYLHARSAERLEQVFADHIQN